MKLRILKMSNSTKHFFLGIISQTIFFTRIFRGETLIFEAHNHFGAKMNVPWSKKSRRVALMKKVCFRAILHKMIIWASSVVDLLSTSPVTEIRDNIFVTTIQEKLYNMKRSLSANAMRYLCSRSGWCFTKRNFIRFTEWFWYTFWWSRRGWSAIQLRWTISSWGSRKLIRLFAITGKSCKPMWCLLRGYLQSSCDWKWVMISKTWNTMNNLNWSAYRIDL